jgi:hypothetical protein
MMGKARRMLNNMDKRERQQKMAVGGLILFMIFAVFLIAYFMFKSPDITTNPTSAAPTVTVTPSPKQP